VDWRHIDWPRPSTNPSRLRANPSRLRANPSRLRANFSRAARLRPLSSLLCSRAVLFRTVTRAPRAITSLCAITRSIKRVPRLIERLAAKRRADPPLSA